MPVPLDRLKGSMPPIITPFAAGDVDYDTYARLVEFQIREGSHGILVNGTTSEPAALTTDERNRLVDIAIGEGLINSVDQPPWSEYEQDVRYRSMGRR